MSNYYIIKNARLTDEPKRIDAGGTDLCELRVADNPLKRTDKNGKPIPSRFVTAKVWGAQAMLAAKLSKGDIICVDGELGVEAFEDKTGAARTKDVLRVQNFIVMKSDTFFEKGQGSNGQESAPPADDGLPF